MVIFLALNASDKLKVHVMIFQLDEGGDLGKSMQICKLFSHYSYSIESIAREKPCQNGFTEVKNHKIGRHL